MGSTIRVRLKDDPKATRRALVATVQQDDETIATTTVCLLMQDDAPRPLLAVASTKSSMANGSNISSSRPFLVTPVMKTTDQETESTVAVADLLELLPFETEQDSSAATNSSDKDDDLKNLHQQIRAYKERGDQLLRLGDASAAATYYETALGLSSTVQIASSIVLKVAGHAKIAEVDCIDGNYTDPSTGSRTLDVSMNETGQERTIQESQVLLSILNPDPERLQERILLNLARCLLQLAENTTFLHQGWPLYLRGAILACTLALSVTLLLDDTQGSISSCQTSALLLRSQAQASLSKFPHAKADLKQLLSLDPQHKQGLKRLHDLERQQVQHKKTEKKLVKQVCQWVQTAATNETVSNNNSSSGSGSSSSSSPAATTAATATTDHKVVAETIPKLPPLPSTTTATNSPAPHFSSWFWINLILVVAFLYQKTVLSL